MEGLLTFALSVFTGFFAIMNPIANTPIFLGLTEDASEVEKKKVAFRSSVTAFIIVTAFVIAGKYIFQLFGLTIPAFKITGGLLVFYVGFEMLQTKKSSIHNQENVPFDEEISTSPLAIPILAGPGTIVTAMNFTTNAEYTHIAIIIGIFAFMIFLTYLAFISSEKITVKLGHNFIAVVGKIMGLILAIIGTGMVLEGIKLADF